jgi:hypothetical protein
VYFVTRLKKNASYKVIERRPINKKQGVTSDQIVSIPTRGGELKLRRVG